MRTTIKVCISLLMFALLFVSCDLFSNNTNTETPAPNPVPQSVTISYNSLQNTPHNGGKYYPIQSGTTEVIITNLPAGNNVNLVRMNPTRDDMGGLATVTANDYSGTSHSALDNYETELACIENDPASYNSVGYVGTSDGPFEIPFIDKTDYAKLEREYKDKHSSRMVEPNFMVANSTNTFAENDTKTFKVEKTNNNNVKVKYTINATLKKEGTHCYIWVANSNYDSTVYGEPETPPNDDNKISFDQVEDLADAFDSLYEIETALIGNSYTTNPETTYFINPQAKISILVYDIEDDYTSTQIGGTFGMFWGGDLYNASVQEDSNEMELLYVDSYFTDRVFTSVISTVAHEFEHMLYFVNKWIEQRITTGETWYTEMGAMMAEDCLATYLSTHAQNFVISTDSTLGRLDVFNLLYFSGGLGYWGSGSAVYTSYAISGIFGCWLQRNYGGKDLINYIVNNDASNEASITKAIQSSGSNDTFLDAFRKFALSFVQPDATAFTLNKSRPADANGNYALVAADPWSETYKNQIDEDDYLYGPLFVPGNYTGIMRRYGFWLSGWNSSACTGVRLNLSAVTGEENYIVITTE